MFDNSVIVRIIGGLGNQMFQYAFIKALSLKRGVSFKLDITSFDYYFRPFELEKFNIQKSYINPFYSGWKINNSFKRFFYYLFRVSTHFMGYYKEKKVPNELLMYFGNKRYFEGYFTSPVFFEKYRDEIINDFHPIKISDENQKIIEKYIKQKNAISVHIRRGDYLNSNNSFLTKIWDSDYYNFAIQYIMKKIKNPVFLFFSDDMNWVKSMFKGKDYIYIDINRGEDSWQDMILMSKCKHNIIANSTFSWWGAYLNENPDKIVICPKIYMKNEFINRTIYPDNWIRI